MNNSCGIPKHQSSIDFMKNHFNGHRVPLDATIELTHKCNFKCVHCYGGHERTYKDLTFDQWLSILKEIKDAGCLNITFTGGEVLTRKDFSKIYTETRKMGFMVSVFSNASLLNENIVKLFYDYPITYFSTTMYGFTPETYGVVTGNANNYYAFMKGLDLLNKYNITVELKAIALRENFDEIAKIYKFAKERGYLFRCAVGIRNRNDTKNIPVEHSITPEEALTLDIKTFPERLDFWKQQACAPNPQPFTDNRRNKHYKFLCHAGEYSFMIDASGFLHCCSVERLSGISLLKNKFKDCWNGYIFNLINTKVSDNFKCLNCEDFRYCEQCTAKIELEGGSKLIPNYDTCKLAKLRHEWCDKYRRENS